VLGASLALVTGFHGWLLARRLLDATIAEPEVLLRWLGACGLLAGAAWLRRAGVSVAQGRPALIFWLLVLLLHVGASPVVVQGVRAEELMLVLPLGVAVAGGALTLAAWRPHRAPRRPAGRRLPPRGGDLPLLRCCAGASPERFYPRPPPFAAAV